MTNPNVQCTQCGSTPVNGGDLLGQLCPVCNVGQVKVVKTKPTLNMDRWYEIVSMMTSTIVMTQFTQPFYTSRVAFDETETNTLHIELYQRTPGRQKREILKRGSSTVTQEELETYKPNRRRLLDFLIKRVHLAASRLEVYDDRPVQPEPPKEPLQSSQEQPEGPAVDEAEEGGSDQGVRGEALQRQPDP